MSFLQKALGDDYEIISFSDDAWEAGMLQLTKQRDISFILNQGMEEVFKQISINTEDVKPATSAGLARNEWYWASNILPTLAINKILFPFSKKKKLWKLRTDVSLWCHHVLNMNLDYLWSFHREWDR